jgi:hypothetical protein
MIVDSIQCSSSFLRFRSSILCFWDISSKMCLKENLNLKLINSKIITWIIIGTVLLITAIILFIIIITSKKKKREELKNGTDLNKLIEKKDNHI